MSASPVFVSAALSRPFLFPVQEASSLLKKVPVGADRLLSHLGALPRLSTPITPASRLEARPVPEMASTGIPELDALIGGLPRGCVTEICGTATSGRTGILLAALAHATRRGEVCALVDASDALDPSSAAAAGIELARLLWIRCGKNHSLQRRGDTDEQQGRNISSIRKNDAVRNACKPVSSKKENEMLSVPSRRGSENLFLSRLEQVLKVTDLLLQSNGFGMIVLDLANIPPRSARCISLASWFRFRRAIEHTPTVLLVIEQHPIAGSCSSVLMRVSGKKPVAVGCQPSPNLLAHTELLSELEIEVELLRSRLERKPARSAVTRLCSQAAWAG